jgi:holliday junction DNA helicase RuvB
VIGNKNAYQKSQIIIEEARNQGFFDPILIYGPSGIGKTTLAKKISDSLNKDIKIINGASIQKPADIINILFTMKTNEVLFIDEVHSCSKLGLEVLYSAIDEKNINISVGQDMNSKILKVSIPNFSLICATTNTTLLPEPFFNRMTNKIKMYEYNSDEIKEIVYEYLKENKIQEFDQNILKNISLYSRGIARNAINYTKTYISILKYSQKYNQKEILKILGMNKMGFKDIEIEYLEYINSKQKPVSLNQIALNLKESPAFVEKEVEKYLIQSDLIDIYSRGRSITEKGKKVIEKINLEKNLK